MPNPLLGILGGGNRRQVQRMPANPAELIQSFEQFKNQFSGDPQVVVRQLIASGKMSQSQFEQLASLANQFGGLLKK